MLSYFLFKHMTHLDDNMDWVKNNIQYNTANVQIRTTEFRDKFVLAGMEI